MMWPATPRRTRRRRRCGTPREALLAVPALVLDRGEHRRRVRGTVRRHGPSVGRRRTEMSLREMPGRRRGRGEEHGGDRPELVRVLAHHAARTPDKALTVFRGETTTYREMADRSAALAASLRAPRVGAGDVVALLLQLPRTARGPLRRQPPRRHRHAHQLAAGGPEVRYILEHSGRRPGVRRRAARAGRRRHRRHRGDDGPGRHRRGRWSARGWLALADVRRRRPPPTPPGCRPPRRTSTASCTSGTTGRPKGVMLQPRQPGVEEPGPPGRVRLPGRRPRPGLRAALPRVRSISPPRRSSPPAPR